MQSADAKAEKRTRRVLQNGIIIRSNKEIEGEESKNDRHGSSSVKVSRKRWTVEEKGSRFKKN